MKIIAIQFRVRLDQIIAEKHKISRSLAKKLIENQQVLINQQIINDPKLEINLKKDEIQIIEKTIDIPKLFENQDFLVIYKPYNISVCRSFNTPKIEKVLNEELLKYTQLSSAQKSREFGLPHRLDKQTEGLMLISKTNDGYQKIVGFFQQQLIKKMYFAYLKPIKNLDFKNNFSVFICKHGYQNFSLIGDQCLCENTEDFLQHDIFCEEQRKRVVPGIKTPTKTLIKIEPDHVKCMPITGVRHQIRFVLQQLGMPIAGDSLYGGAKHDRTLLFSVFIAIPINN